ncbi:MAG: hypothetical protein QNJ55_00130 [Xenococcus sp. MO_188.B8]|nr:hypothetical protein [Xenococcus sp. MO_188.B8]
MSHPFDLDSSAFEALDLDFEDQLTEEQSAQVGGGLTIATTQSVGEEGGFDYPSDRPWYNPYPEPKPYPPIVCVTHPCLPYPNPETKPYPDPETKPYPGPYTKAYWENG